MILQLFYESVFFRLDSDGNGFVTFDEVGGFLGFTAVTLTPEEREVKMLSVDASSKLDGQVSIGPSLRARSAWTPCAFHAWLWCLQSPTYFFSS